MLKHPDNKQNFSNLTDKIDPVYAEINEPGPNHNHSISAESIYNVANSSPQHKYASINFQRAKAKGKNCRNVLIIVIASLTILFLIAAAVLIYLGISKLFYGNIIFFMYGRFSIGLLCCFIIFFFPSLKYL